MVEPGAPGQVPKEKGKPKEQGVPRAKGIPPGKGIPPEKGVPRGSASLPVAGAHRVKGAPGQIDRGDAGQLDKLAENPWAPTPDTVLEEVDKLVPPSRPPPPEPKK
jgi:hypothetical protein